MTSTKVLRILSTAAAVISGVGLAVAGAVHQLPTAWQPDALAGVGVASVAGIAITAIVAQVRGVEANAAVVASGQVPAALIAQQPSVASPGSPLGESSVPTAAVSANGLIPEVSPNDVNADLGPVTA